MSLARAAGAGGALLGRWEALVLVKSTWRNRGNSSQLSDVMRGFIYDTKSIMFDQHLVLSALSNVGIFISICGQLKKVTNKR